MKFLKKHKIILLIICLVITTGKSMQMFSESKYAKEVTISSISLSIVGKGWNLVFDNNYEKTPITKTIHVNGDGILPVLSQEDKNKLINRKGYKIKGFYDYKEETSGEKQYYNQNCEKVINVYKPTSRIENLTLYARWEPIKYNVIFNANASDATGTMASQEIEYDKKVSLSDNKYVREDYKFIKWNTKADGTGISYNNNELVYNLSEVENENINLYAIWGPSKHLVNYGTEFKKIISSDAPNYVEDGENLVVNLNSSDVDINNISITMNNKKLKAGTDYTLAGSLLTVKNITADVNLDLISSATGSGVTIETKWIDKYTVDVTLNGDESETIYVRLYKDDLYIGSSTTDLYVKKYADNPMFKKGENVFISFTPISGTATLTSSLTIKLRNAKTNCSALSTAELIAETPGKTNFYIDTPITRTGVLTENSSYLSLYSVAGNKFDNFKFRITYGVVSE